MSQPGRQDQRTGQAPPRQRQRAQGRRPPLLALLPTPTGQGRPLLPRTPRPLRRSVTYLPPTGGSAVIALLGALGIGTLINELGVVRSLADEISSRKVTVTDVLNGVWTGLWVLLAAYFYIYVAAAGVD